MSNELLVLPTVSMDTVKGLNPPVVPTGDVIAASMLEVANAGVLALKFAAKTGEITSAEQYKDVLDAAKSCRSSIKALSAKRKEFTDPSEDWKTRTISVEKSLADIFDQAFKHFEHLAVDWESKEKAKAEAERQRIQRELAEKAAIAEAERKAKEAAEQLKRAEEDAWLEYAQMEAESAAEEAASAASAYTDAPTASAASSASAAYADEAKAAAELKAQEAEIERQRAEREAIRRKEEAEAEAKRHEELRKASAAMSTLKHTAPKGVKKTWDFTIVNPDKVVRQFLVPDEKKIRAANKAGLLVDGEGKPTELAAGLNIFEVSGLTGRGAGAR